jgi:hypothetical protein
MSQLDCYGTWPWSHFVTAGFRHCVSVIFEKVFRLRDEARSLVRSIVRYFTFSFCCCSSGRLSSKPFLHGLIDAMQTMTTMNNRHLESIVVDENASAEQKIDCVRLSFSKAVDFPSTQ